MANQQGAGRQSKPGARPETVERNQTKEQERAAAKKAETTEKEYRVKQGHSFTRGETDDEGNPRIVEYVGGETIKLTEKEANAAPWALEAAERRRGRDGQVPRLQRQIQALETQIKNLQQIAEGSGDAKTRKAAQELREQAIQSLRFRGDAHPLRGEPTPHVAAAETIEGFDRVQDLEYVAQNAGLASDDDEMGLTGFGRANVSNDPSARDNFGPRDMVGAAGAPSIPQSGEEPTPSGSEQKPSE